VAPIKVLLQLLKDNRFAAQIEHTISPRNIEQATDVRERNEAALACTEHALNETRMSQVQPAVLEELTENFAAVVEFGTQNAARTE
jgi:hypothetical protein